MDTHSVVSSSRTTRLRNPLFGIVTLALVSAALSWHAPARVEAQAPTVPFRLMEATILETQAALEAGTLTSEDLVRMYLARIDAYDKRGPAINAMIALNPNALAEARALDTERRLHGSRGLLHGIPVLLKDNYDTGDMPTTASSLSLATSIPPDDGYLVRRLREAGAVFIGKTNLHEFAFGITSISSLGGQSLNPYALNRNPGGSSGGTGAAVAANFGVIGMGSDTCGSIRIPSSHNSLFGLRATQGLFSRDGIIPLSLTQDMGGPLARTVEDLAIVLDLTAGYDPNDPVTESSIRNTPDSYMDFLRTGRLRGARFGVLTDAMVTVPEDQEVADVIRAAAEELENQGATVIDVSIPDYVNVSNVSVITQEFRDHLDQYLAATPAAPFTSLQAIFDSGLFHPSLTTVLTNSLAVPPISPPSPDYARRLAGRQTFKDAILQVLTDHHLDALIYPTIRQKPILVPSTAQPGSNCRVSAHSGLPAISVPAGFTGDGIPVGMEFLSRDYTEGDLLELAYSWEQATHVRRLPASTPDLEPPWQHRLSDGAADLDLNQETHQLRFRVRDGSLDTHVYLDPTMREKNGIIFGQFKDARWQVKYFVDTRGRRVSTAWFDDLRQPGRDYTLHGIVEPR